jgi:hypothetical protein
LADQIERRKRVIENLQEISELKAKYRYSVAKGIGKWLRRTRLIWAVQDLGLHYVVKLISGHVRLRDLQEDERWDECIEKWESDLEWLKGRYYDGMDHWWCWVCLVTDAYDSPHREEVHNDFHIA